MIGFLQRLIGLRDEGGGPLDALLAVGDLLGELPNPLCLHVGEGWRKTSVRTRPSARENTFIQVAMWRIIKD